MWYLNMITISITDRQDRCSCQLNVNYRRLTSPLFEFFRIPELTPLLLVLDLDTKRFLAMNSNLILSLKTSFVKFQFHPQWKRKTTLQLPGPVTKSRYNSIHSFIHLIFIYINLPRCVTAMGQCHVPPSHIVQHPQGI